jgi:hypothetical protein
MSDKAGAIGAAATMFGGPLTTGFIGWNKARKARKAQENKIREEKAANEAWYARNYYQDMVNSVEGQSALKRVKEAADERVKEAQAREAIAGGTGSQVEQAQKAGINAVSNTAMGLAEQGAAIKRDVDAQKLSLDAGVREEEKDRLKADQASGEALLNNSIDGLKQAITMAATGGASAAAGGAAGAIGAAGSAAGAAGSTAAPVSNAHWGDILEDFRNGAGKF